MNKLAGGVLVVLIIAMSLSGAGCLAGNLMGAATGTATYQAEAAHDVVKDTYTADNAIRTYEWFKDQHADIVSTEKKIRTADSEIAQFKEDYGDPQTWDHFTREDYQELRDRRTGLVNMYDTYVEEYNAEASKANKAIFKDKLPFHVDKILW